MVYLVFYAYHGIRANTYRHDAILRNLPYLGIACVGVGSAIFHATLKNYTQWCQWPFLSSLSFTSPYERSWLSRLKREGGVFGHNARDSV